MKIPSHADLIRDAHTRVPPAYFVGRRAALIPERGPFCGARHEGARGRMGQG